MKGLVKVAGVDMQGLMNLDCPRKCSGTFEAYQGKIYVTALRNKMVLRGY